jgi:hypothetical protein
MTLDKEIIEVESAKRISYFLPVFDPCFCRLKTQLSQTSVMLRTIIWFSFASKTSLAVQAARQMMLSWMFCQGKTSSIGAREQSLNGGAKRISLSPSIWRIDAP